MKRSYHFRGSGCLRLIVLLLATLLAIPAHARGNHNGGYHSTGHHNSNYCSTCARDSQEHIKRSPEAKSEFKKSHPCPSTGKSSGACPGYVIDHKKALKRGGADEPSNMQWQTKEQAKEKDKTE